MKRTKQRLESSTTRQLSSDSATSSCASLAKTPSSETLLFNFAEAINDTLIDRTKTTNAEITTNSAISEKIDIPSVESGAFKNSRLSFSAPEPSSLDLVTQGCALSRSTSNVSSDVSELTKTSVKRQKSCLENWQKDSQTFKKTEEGLETSSLGKVQNLKKEFEAKSSSTCLEQTVPEPLHENAQKKNRSLPSSPVCVHQTKENPKVGDDLNFDNIRSVFETKKEDGQVVRMRQKYPKPNRNNARYSCFEVSVDKNRMGGTQLISNINKPEENEQLKRPPKVPAVQQIAATVIATAAKKKQQQFGKTHPLARINIKPRHNNPVYNTM